MQLGTEQRIAASALDLIGNTPMVRLARIAPAGAAELLAKLESMNPAGSVKDRIALAMIEDAEQRGVLKPGDTIVEPTSGNTGIGLAMVAAVKGYKLVITMQENVSVERRKLLQRYGAQLILTPAIEGMTGAVFAAEELVRKNPSYFMPQQFNNPANPEAHRRTTALEILRDTEGRLDAFVAGVGTGGTLTGVGEVLKQKLPGVLIVAVEPARSQVLGGGKAGLTAIDGLGASFVPSVLNRDVYDDLIAVKDEDAMEMTKRLTRSEGLLVGVSAGANVHAALQIAKRLGDGKRVVTVLPDTGERYLSVNF
ncbi:MAG TPA: cysteine synthase A [Dehalococcoidia bacterium]|nr:cysteine synthase A [Dehalococcoidia bacterium]